MTCTCVLYFVKKEPFTYLERIKMRSVRDFRQLQVTRMIAQVLDAEQASEDKGL